MNIIDTCIAELEEMVAKQTRWQADLRSLMGRLPSGTFKELSSLGPVAAPLVSELAFAADDELAEFDRMVSS